MSARSGAGPVRAAALRVAPEPASCPKRVALVNGGSEQSTVTGGAVNAISSAGGSRSIGNFLDDVFFGTAPCVVVTKAAIPAGPVDVGDVITCRLTARNEGGAAEAISYGPVQDGAP
ncbi:hypothetical protein ABZV14_36480 [Streptosporangium canum]|uniref:hypothetical protein n=1 Tax=Streptosporangium canum TaxID=324952 RepID=UPI0033A202FF